MRVFADLNKKLDQILRKNRKANEPVPGPGEDVPFDETLNTKLKDLFHEDAWSRLAAIRWFRQQRYTEAVTVLEGVLSIEESDEVRSEIERTLRVLNVCRSNNKGDEQCSKSSEVCL